LTAILSAFVLFRTVYKQDLIGVIPSIVNVLWTWFYMSFLIAAIFMADAITKSVSLNIKNIISDENLWENVWK
jgi:hypothetical protein